MKRKNNLDIVAGILIVYMFTLHTKSVVGLQIDNVFPKIPLLFAFMGWFFYKAGMFHRVTTDFRTHIAKTTKRLLVPYTIFSVVSIFNEFLWHIFDDGYSLLNVFVKPIWQIIKLGGVSANLPIWFLLSLFLVKLIYYYVDKYKINVYFVLSICFLCAFFLNYFHVEYPCWFGNVFIGLFFYTAGHILNEKQYSFYFVMAALVIYVVLYIFIPSNVDVRANKLTCGNYLIYYVTAVTSCIILNRFSMYMSSRVLSYIGRNSMCFYLCHWMILIYSHRFIQFFLPHVIPVFEFSILIILVLLITPFLNILLNKEKTRWIIGL